MNDQPTPPPTLVQKLQAERDAALLALSQAEGLLKANPPLGVSSMRWLDQRILDVRRMLALALDGSFIDALMAERAEYQRLSTLEAADCLERYSRRTIDDDYVLTMADQPGHQHTLRCGSDDEDWWWCEVDCENDDDCTAGIHWLHCPQQGEPR